MALRVHDHARGQTSLYVLDVQDPAPLKLSLGDQGGFLQAFLVDDYVS